MADESIEATVEDNNSLELEVNPPYVGSAYSPEVDIEETTSTITVTITDARGEHSYSVPNPETAIANAGAATTAANNAATAANSAASAATTAKNNANTAATAANNAATLANQKAGQASDAAATATQAANSANGAAEVASAKAAAANTAAAAATSAASAAGNAASAANSAVDYADRATRDASAAADAANSAANAANAAAGAAESATATVDAAVASANSAASYANEKGGAASNAANAANDAASAASTWAVRAQAAAEAAEGVVMDDIPLMSANIRGGAKLGAGLAIVNGALELDGGGDIATAVDAWLDAHPEATTTVEDGAITMEKFADDVLDEFDHKADVDGYYETLTAGAADNLTGRGDGVGAEYIYRTAGGTADVADGTARIDVIKGNTVVWNQLAKPHARNTTILGSLTITVTAGGLVSFSGSPNSSGGRTTSICEAFNIVNGHKYFLRDTLNYAQSGNQTGWYLTRMDDSTAIIPPISRNTFYTATESSSVYLGKNVLQDETYDCSGYVCFFDLTQMFGAGNEPATVEEFEALYPLPYYAYDAGTLLPVNMEGVKTVGFNQWDEIAETGYINVTTGANDDSVTRYRSKNYIPVFPNTEYYFKNSAHAVANNVQYRKYFYDADKNFIGSPSASYSSLTFTTPANAHYMRFFVDEALSNFDHTICINLSWSGYRNGEYEPYWEFEREIPVETYFPNGMRSAGTAYDELQRDKAVTRIGAVDLGTLTWIYNNNNRFSSLGIANTAKIPSSDSVYPNIITENFEVIKGSASLDNNHNAIALLSRDGSLIAYAESSSAPTPTGMLFYELATPTETEIDPPLNLSYKVSDFGTERVIVPTGEMTAPVPMQIVYGLNAVDTLRRLPVNYISHASMAQFIAAIESHFNVTITETYDEDEERYEYSITANESAGE